MAKMDLETIRETLELDRAGELDPDFRRYWWDVDGLCAEVEELRAANAALSGGTVPVAALEAVRGSLLARLLEFLLPGKWHGHDFSARPLQGDDWSDACHGLMKLGLLKLAITPDGEAVETTAQGMCLLAALGVETEL